MKQLNKILERNHILEAKGDLNLHVENLVFDSRQVTKGSLFFAMPGTITDGHQFIGMAIEKGALAVVCEDFPNTLHPNITYIKVNSSASALGYAASAFFDNPSQKMKLVGITGTNGKTTTVTILHHLTNRLDKKAGLISTVQNQIGDEVIPSSHTTPDAIELNKLLKRMLDSGCQYCFMEVSSHAIHQKRIEGLTFTGGIFSNISHDHLDYHKSFSEYIKAKKEFFDNLKNDAFALTNIDDRNGMVMVQNTKAKKYTYSIRSMANFKCKVIEQQPQGMLLIIDNTELWSRLIGNFNAYNLLAVYATAMILGFNQQETLTILSDIKPVNGRFENMIAPNGVMAIIDYAHTPDALENVVSTIQKIMPTGKRLITVVGTGGNRDKSKRPIMAQVAIQGSNMVILTSDNPRNEEPIQIIEDMKKGVDPSSVGKVLTITDRREAIRTACLLANPGDIVLVAGKGHETYQEVNGVKHHFDDKEEVNEIFKTLKA
ncbi:MAG: UDP-N-acetylmuramoyl-L-alanyl-D-glutamate--2,6-diaminopimelate ligase [Bacteroidales bacterium]